MNFISNYVILFVLAVLIYANNVNACSVAKANEYTASADSYIKRYYEVKNSKGVYTAKIISATKDLKSEMIDDCYGTSTWKVKAKINSTLRGDTLKQFEIDAEAEFDDVKKSKFDVNKSYFILTKELTNNVIEISGNMDFEEQYIRSLAAGDYKKNPIYTISESLKSVKDNEIAATKDCLIKNKEKDQCFKDKKSADKFFSYIMWSSSNYKNVLNVCAEQISANSSFFEICSHNLIFRIASEDKQQAQKRCVEIKKINKKDCQSIVKFAPKNII